MKRSTAVAAAFVLAAGPALAQTATPDITEKLQLCTGCHGEGGLPVNPDMPITWGQNYYYLYVQLKDYASGRRQNEEPADRGAGTAQDPAGRGPAAGLSGTDHAPIEDKGARQRAGEILAVRHLPRRGSKGARGLSGHALVRVWREPQ